VDSSVVGYDGARNVRDEERLVAADTDHPPADDQEDLRKSSVVPKWGIITALAIFASVVIVIIYGYLARPGWIGVSDKTFWDYLELLIVPAALAIGVYWLNRAQSARERAADEARDRRERKAEEDRRERERRAAEDRREHELELESQRAQDEALQAYLDHMSGMLLPDTGQPSLYRAQPGDSLSSVARARTLTVLPRLAGDRKARVVQFLYEADLITRGRPIVDLALADLRALSVGNLRKAYLSDTVVKEVYKAAELINANLSRADLSGANLSGADLSYTSLSEANLSDADLSKADLSYANLSEANLSRAVLRDADLSRRTNLINANLRGADLSEADLRDAELSGVDLSYANLRRAKLYEDDLSVPPELIETTRITNEQLEERAKSLKGTTLTNGQKYEDWLKDKEG
jgi:hypothetical protein